MAHNFHPELLTGWLADCVLDNWWNMEETQATLSKAIKRMERVKEVFDTLDDDGSGALSRSEIKALAKSLNAKLTDHDLDASVCTRHALMNEIISSCFVAVRPPILLRFMCDCPGHVCLKLPDGSDGRGRRRRG